MSHCGSREDESVTLWIAGGERKGNGHEPPPCTYIAGHRYAADGLVVCLTAAESFLRADVAMSGLCRPKQERTSHALLQGLLLLSVWLAPSQAHPGGARPCPLLEVSPADVRRAPGSSGPHAPENEGLVAHCPVMIPRETPGSADAPCCMSVALLCPHGYPSFCYCLPLAAEHATEDLSAGDAACAPVSTSEMHS